MRSNELRTGNIILRLGNESIVDWSTIKLCHQRNKQFNEDWKPIPLTPEWLERFGFEEKGKAMGDRVWSKVVKWNDPDGELRVHPTFDLDHFNSSMFIWFNNLMNRRIDTVHELQNLFYSITGTELELKQ